MRAVDCWARRRTSVGPDDWRQVESCIYEAAHWLEMSVVEAGYGLARARP